MRGKGLVRDLVLIVVGVGIATGVSARADTTSKQGSRDEIPDSYTITCNAGEITNAGVNESSWGVSLHWANAGTGFQGEGGATFRECVLSSDK